MLSKPLLIASRLSTLGVPIGDVLGVSPVLEVRRLNTERGVARVHRDPTVTFAKSKDDPGHPFAPTAHHDHRIAICLGDSPRPETTPAWFARTSAPANPCRHRPSRTRARSLERCVAPPLPVVASTPATDVSDLAATSHYAPLGRLNATHSASSDQRSHRPALRDPRRTATRTRSQYHCTCRTARQEGGTRDRARARAEAPEAPESDRLDSPLDPVLWLRAVLAPELRVRVTRLRSRDEEPV